MSNTTNKITCPFSVPVLWVSSGRDEIALTDQLGRRSLRVKTRYLKAPTCDEMNFVLLAINKHDQLVEALQYVAEQIDLDTSRYKDADDTDSVVIEVTVGWLRECRDALNNGV